MWTLGLHTQIFRATDAKLYVSKLQRFHSRTTTFSAVHTISHQHRLWWLSLWSSDTHWHWDRVTYRYRSRRSPRCAAVWCNQLWLWWNGSASLLTAARRFCSLSPDSWLPHIRHGSPWEFWDPGSLPSLLKYLNQSVHIQTVRTAMITWLCSLSRQMRPKSAFILPFRSSLMGQFQSFYPKKLPYVLLIQMCIQLFTKCQQSEWSRCSLSGFYVINVRDAS